MKYNGLDVYDIVLGESSIGISATSLVTLPATESSFLHFGEESPQFKFADEEKRELIGAIMIPDKLIFRKIGETSFYVNFTKEIIRDLTSKMIKDGTAGVFTVQHSVDVTDDSVEVQEVWIKETEQDKSVAFGIDEPIGASFMKVKINDDIIWNAIKDNGLNGFSIELDAAIAKKKEVFNEIKPEEKMNITDVFSNTVNANDVELYFNAELVKGAYLVFADKDGKPSAYSGEFTHNSTKFSVENGVVTEALNIQLSTDEQIKALADAFSVLAGKLDGFSETEEKLTADAAEFELLKEQFELAKAEFEASKTAGEGTKLSFAAQMAANAAASKEWKSQFKKK